MMQPGRVRFQRLRLLAISTLLIMSGCAVPPNAGIGNSVQSGLPVAAASADAVDTATAASLPDCDLSELTTRTHGVLTIATGERVEMPWFTSNDLATSDGYEAAVAKQIAATLGFEPDTVKWLHVDTDRAVDGSTAEFDLLIDRVAQQPSNTAKVDLSTGYYAITDTLVMPHSAAGKLNGSVSELSTIRLGIIAGSSGEAAIRDAALTPTAFATLEAGVDALRLDAIDGLVVSTPDALDLQSADQSLSVVGQLPTGKWQPDQFHLVLAKDSPLTPCVNAAVDRLRVEGTLDKLTQQWVAPLAPPLS